MSGESCQQGAAAKSHIAMLAKTCTCIEGWCKCGWGRPWQLARDRDNFLQLEGESIMETKCSTYMVIYKDVKHFKHLWTLSRPLPPPSQLPHSWCQLQKQYPENFRAGALASNQIGPFWWAHMRNTNSFQFSYSQGTVRATSSTMLQLQHELRSGRGFGLQRCRNWSQVLSTIGFHMPHSQWNSATWLGPRAKKLLCMMR